MTFPYYEILFLIPCFVTWYQIALGSTEVGSTLLEIWSHNKKNRAVFKQPEYGWTYLNSSLLHKHMQHYTIN